jgi:uncharacterized membrane protein YdjX (TVP38/TMEM64 family)
VHTRARSRLALAAILGVAILLLVASDAAHRWLVWGLEQASRLASVQPALAMALIVVFSAIAAMLAFVSSWVLVPFAVFTWSEPVALLLLWTGWLVGGAATYAVGRFLGRPAVGWLLPAESLERYEARFVRTMPFYVILLVQLALPSEVPGYLLGLVRYSFARYLAALAIVEMAYGVVTVYLGQQFVERQLLAVIAGLTLLASITIAAAYLLRVRVWAHRPDGAPTA